MSEQRTEKLQQILHVEIYELFELLGPGVVECRNGRQGTEHRDMLGNFLVGGKGRES